LEGQRAIRDERDANTRRTNSSGSQSSFVVLLRCRNYTTALYKDSLCYFLLGRDTLDSAQLEKQNLGTCNCQVQSYRTSNLVNYREVMSASPDQFVSLLKRLHRKDIPCSMDARLSICAYLRIQVTFSSWYSEPSFIHTQPVRTSYSGPRVSRWVIDSCTVTYVVRPTWTHP